MNWWNRHRVAHFIVGYPIAFAIIWLFKCLVIDNLIK